MEIITSYKEALLEVVRFKSAISDYKMIPTQEFCDLFDNEDECEKWIKDFYENALSEKIEAERNIHNLLERIQHFHPSVRRDLILAQLIWDSRKLEPS